MTERRRYIRIPEDSQISYKVVTGIKSDNFLTRDLSQGGIRFFIHEFIAKGSILRIRLTLEKTSFSFEALVRIVWITEDIRNDRYEIGVEFVDIPAEATEYLIAYIKSVLKFQS